MLNKKEAWKVQEDSDPANIEKAKRELASLNKSGRSGLLFDAGLSRKGKLEEYLKWGYMTFKKNK